MAVQLSVKVRNAVLVSKKLEDFTVEVKKISAGRIYGRMESARKMLTRYPAPYNDDPEHHWPEGEKGKRARRWYFWALSVGKVNPPGQYERTGRYMDSWSIAKTEDGNGYILRSSYPAAKWLAGTATDPMMQYHAHRGRWATLREAVEASVAELPKEINDNIAMVARRSGFKA